MYKQAKRSGELYHYGIKGMKWSLEALQRRRAEWGSVNKDNVNLMKNDGGRQLVRNYIDKNHKTKPKKNKRNGHSSLKLDGGRQVYKDYRNTKLKAIKKKRFVKTKRFLHTMATLVRKTKV